MTEKLCSRGFGETGIRTSIVGLGGGQVGSAGLSEQNAEKLLNGVVDIGITMIDTARGYGESEERIGRHISHRRGEYILSSKCGYDIPGQENWTRSCVAAGVDAALQRMRTDHLDIMHLHSCDKEVLERGEVISALEDAVRAGKVLIAAYSGENENLEYAISTGRFRSLQTSVNICDQGGIHKYLPESSKRGMGVIAKRPLANAPWIYNERPIGQYAEVYWERFRQMGFEKQTRDWDEIALRFAAYAPGVSCVITGSSNLDHLKKNVAAVEKGPLPEDLRALLESTFRQFGEKWTGQV